MLELRHVGFETDDTAETVESVLARAAARLSMPPAVLEAVTDHTFAVFLSLPAVAVP